MSRRISDGTKIKQKRGTGHFEDYKPWININELSSTGTASVIKDWKHGRGVQCMSQAELMYYLLLRWDDDNIDITEQYPLPPEETDRIADSFGFRRPAHIMTTDFVCWNPGMKPHAYAVKTSLDLPKRKKELLMIEREYWKRHDVPFNILLKENVNAVLANNIRLVTRFYNESAVFDHYSEIKHKIARKEYEADMSHALLDAAALEAVYDKYNKPALEDDLLKRLERNESYGRPYD